MLKRVQHDVFFYFVILNEVKNLFLDYCLPSTLLRKLQHHILVILNEVKNLLNSLDCARDGTNFHSIFATFSTPPILFRPIVILWPFQILLLA